MAIISVDMNQKSEFQGGAVPDGDYVCEVLSITEGKSRVQGSPQLNVIMEILEPEGYQGLRLFDFLPLSDAAMFRRADFFFACGIQDEGEVDVDTDALCRETEEGEQLNENGVTISVRKSTQPDRDDPNRKRIRMNYSPLDAEEAPEEEVQEEPEPEPEPEEEKPRRPARRSAAPKPPAKKPASGKKKGAGRRVRV
jgi:hypothetical protein